MAQNLSGYKTGFVRPGHNCFLLVMLHLKGLGTALAHVMEDRQERQIAYGSRTMRPAEQGYSQLEKEGLVIVFGI